MPENGLQEENKMEKTMSMRIGAEDYAFIKNLAKENKKDLSEAVRTLVDRGRLMYAIERYRDGKASLGTVSQIAGVSISEMMNILARFGIESNVGYDDYARGLESLKKVW